MLWCCGNRYTLGHTGAGWCDHFYPRELKSKRAVHICFKNFTAKTPIAGKKVGYLFSAVLALPHTELEHARFNSSTANSSE